MSGCLTWVLVFYRGLPFPVSVPKWFITSPGTLYVRWEANRYHGLAVGFQGCLSPSSVAHSLGCWGCILEVPPILAEGFPQELHQCFNVHTEDCLRFPLRGAIKPLVTCETEKQGELPPSSEDHGLWMSKNQDVGPWLWPLCWSSDGSQPSESCWEWMDIDSQLSLGWGSKRSFSSVWWQTPSHNHGFLFLHFLSNYVFTSEK